MVRKSKDGGGGLALGCDKILHPVWVRDGEDDNVEALSVEISVKNMTIRCCVAYGCQESEIIERKNVFWAYLDEEVYRANESGSGLVLHFDGNLWAGTDIIPGDPRKQNRNGKLFEEFLSRNPHLSVVNGLPLCQGLITRSRLRDGILEESVLDFFLVCDRVLPFVTSMVIDESRKYILTNSEQVRKGGKACDSDHATEIMDVNLEVLSEKPVRRELYNFKDKESQNIFKQATSETLEFTSCFEDDLPVMEQVEKWRTVLKSFCSKSFKKIRIKNRKNMKSIKPAITNLINKRNSLVGMKKNMKQVEDLNKAISEMEAEDNREKILEHFKCYSDDPERINVTQMWKTVSKLWPKCGTTLPTAKKNHRGKIISGPRELKKLLAKEYKERLRSRPVRPDLLPLENLKKTIFKLEMKLAELNKSPECAVSDWG
jgi:hypothetical protein